MLASTYFIHLSPSLCIKGSCLVVGCVKCLYYPYVKWPTLVVAMTWPLWKAGHINCLSRNSPLPLTAREPFNSLSFLLFSLQIPNSVNLSPISIWSASYSLEKNSSSSGGVTSFTNQVRTCTSIMHIISRLIGLISRLIGLISRLGHELVDWYFGIVD